MTRTGRRPGDSGSRQAIRDAAWRQFSEQGYAAATIRSIADEAKVDPALVMHFFGSKDQLFAACVEWPFDPAEAMAAVSDDGPTGAGERLVRLFVQTWDSEQGRNPVVTLLRAAMTQEPAERLLREFLSNQLLGPLIGALGLDHGELRADLVASQLLGLGVTRYVLRFDRLASLPPELVVACVAPTVQAYLTGPLPKELVPS